MHSSDDGGFPIYSALLDGATQTQGLDIHTGPRQIVQILFGDRRHPKATLWLGDHQSFRGKSGQGFANAADTDGALLGDEVNLQLGAGTQSAGEDVGSQVLINALE